MTETPLTPTCGAVHDSYPETVCTEPPRHRMPHSGPLIIGGRECGGTAWGPDHGTAPETPGRTETGATTGNAQADRTAGQDNTALRERICAAIRDATCQGGCGLSEAECTQQRIQPVVWNYGGLALVEGTPGQLADAVLPLVTEARTAGRAEGLREAADILASKPCGCAGCNTAHADPVAFLRARAAAMEPPALGAGRPISSAVRTEGRGDGRGGA